MKDKTMKDKLIQDAIKGMVEAGDPTLQPLIDALEAELAAHDAAKKEQQEREDKAKSRELIKWFASLPLTTQMACQLAAGGADQGAEKVTMRSFLVMRRWNAFKKG